VLRRSQRDLRHYTPVLTTKHYKGNGKFLPWTILPSVISPLPCSVRVRVRSGVSRVRVRVRVRVRFMVRVKGKCPGEMSDTPSKHCTNCHSGCLFKGSVGLELVALVLGLDRVRVRVRVRFMVSVRGKCPEGEMTRRRCPTLHNNDTQS